MSKSGVPSKVGSPSDQSNAPKQPRDLSKDPFVRLLAARIIRLERELKPILLQKYQTPEATKAALDTPIPDDVINVWIGELSRQARLDEVRSTELAEQEAATYGDSDQIRAEMATMPEDTRSAVESAFEKKKELAGR